MSFSIIYREDNSSPDFVNIIAYLHGIFGKMSGEAYGPDWPGIIKPTKSDYSMIQIVGSSCHNGVKVRADRR